MSNRLIHESSPYLLQHAENPVDWYPWGEEAFARARQEDKPIFLSIGYSTCHWCHVMARESFENEEIADILNKNFISIKVDREERPDIDSVYMSVCQELNGSGGWPLTIFMTADQKPFYAGTYFPTQTRYGRMGFREVLQAIARQWKSDKEGLLVSADRIVENLAGAAASAGTQEYEIDGTLAEKAAILFGRSFDEVYGGFGMPPKFPTPHNLLFLTLYSQVPEETNLSTRAFGWVEKTLEQMRRGGLFDQIGYGFSRYSTDARYLVPHFEKMLYDNALLILAYAAAYKVSGKRLYLDTAEKTADYIFREMTGDEGEFYSAQDADSEGEEGSFYVWKYEEIVGLLGQERGTLFCQQYGITEQGNFQGENIPNLLGGGEIPDEFQREREILYRHRKERKRLHLDDKVLTSWNALMICAMVFLYRVTGKKQYLTAASRGQQFIEKYLSQGNLLYVSCRHKKCSEKGFLDEYAYYTAALLCLYDATADTGYRERAVKICRQAQRQFADEKGEGFFLCGLENGRLITRPKEFYDGAVPSGNSVMAYCLVRLSQILGQEEFSQAAKRQLAYLSGEAERFPMGHSMFLIALLFYFYPPTKITVLLSREDRMEEVVPKLPLCAEISVVKQNNEHYQLLNGKTTYYVCRGQVCLPPTNKTPV